jgi:predicted RNA-binding Zn-ribbon protein involved in translation (DUF1610 family)
VNLLVRKNLMTIQGYSPYCGNYECKTSPRTKFNGDQFKCPRCGWVSMFPKEFIDKYKEAKPMDN